MNLPNNHEMEKCILRTREWAECSQEPQSQGQVAACSEVRGPAREAGRMGLALPERQSGGGGCQAERMARTRTRGTSRAMARWRVVRRAGKQGQPRLQVAAGVKKRILVSGAWKAGVPRSSEPSPRPIPREATARLGRTVLPRTANEMGGRAAAQVTRSLQVPSSPLPLPQCPAHPIDTLECVPAPERAGACRPMF